MNVCQKVGIVAASESFGLCKCTIIIRIMLIDRSRDVKAYHSLDDGLEPQPLSLFEWIPVGSGEQPQWVWPWVDFTFL